MSGSIWTPEASRALHASRRDARNFRNANDPLRGQPVPPEPRQRRRRRQPQRNQEVIRQPRFIFRVTEGDPWSFDLGKIANHENLALIWHRLRAFNGHSPGLDQMSFDMSASQVMEVLRNLSRAMHNRRYVPAPTRPVQIPNSTGGHRKLEIPTIIDRVVGAALAESLRPVLVDRLPRHFGKGAGCHSIFARMCMMAEDRGWYWVGVNDIQNFFPSIRRSLALDCFMRQADRWGVPEPTLVQQGIRWLIRQLIYGNEGDTRAIGLAQGSSFSPLASAIVLKEVLDDPTDRQIENRMILHRYADNLLVQGPDRFEVGNAMEDISSTLNQYGMRLKDTSTQVIDVRVPTNQTILGVRPKWTNGKLSFDIPEDKWVRLERILYGTTTGSGSHQAQSTVHGFISAFRPTFRVKADNAINRIHRSLREGGNYSISRDTISTWITAERSRWESELINIRNPQLSLPQQSEIVIPEQETGPLEPDTLPWHD